MFFSTQTFTNNILKLEEKREEIGRSRMTNTPKRKQIHSHNNTFQLETEALKHSITERLRIDIGRLRMISN